MWVTQSTANLLRRALGSLNPAAIATAVEAARIDQKAVKAANQIFGALAVEVLIPAPAYLRLKNAFDGVSDEHNLKQLANTLKAD